MEVDESIGFPDFLAVFLLPGQWPSGWLVKISTSWETIGVTGPVSYPLSKSFMYFEPLLLCSDCSMRIVPNATGVRLPNTETVESRTARRSGRTI